MPYPESIHSRLCAIYEDLMWLSGRPHVTPRQARAWYSQVMAQSLARRVRMFTGMVSKAVAEDPTQKLVLEHYGRLSFTLSRMIEEHVATRVRDPDAFVALVERCERVNITTDRENHRARVAEGDYIAAGITLVGWADLPHETRQALWQRCLNGKVANASDFVTVPAP